MKPLHIFQNTAHSRCKPSTLMSSSTHSFHVFLFLPLHIAPVTSTILQPNTHPSTFLRSRCPSHLNLPCLTTSATLCTSRRLYKSTQCFLYFSDTLHIHLTIIHSVLSRLCRFAFFIAQVSVPYVNTLWTQALIIFPFMWYDAPRAVKIGDNSETCKACFFHIRVLRHIRASLTTKASKTIAAAIVGSKLDFCNSLLADPFQI